MNPLSAIKRGLLAAGRNFDRNAAGDLPETMGADFTPDVRSRARANAIMAIGQSLAGTRPLAEGLRSGQEAMLGAWQGRQALAQQRLAQAAMEAAQRPLAQDPGAAAQSSSPENLLSRAQRYDEAADAMMRIGKLDQAKVYYDHAKILQERAGAMTPKSTGEPKVYLNAAGKRVLVQPMSDGSFREVTNYAPTPEFTAVDTGGAVHFVDRSEPPDSIPKEMTPGERSSLDQRQTEFSQTFPLQQKATQSGRIAANAAASNAATNAARLQRELPGARMEQGAVQDIAAMRQGQSQLDSLETALESKKAWLGLLGGAATLPWVGGLVQMVSSAPASLEAEIGMARQVIGKALEGGVLRKEDEMKYAKMLPDITDTPTVARRKLNHVRGRLAENLRIYLEEQQKAGRRTESSPASAEGVPSVGSLFQGKKVVSVTPVK